jgi:hypothetical protein
MTSAVKGPEGDRSWNTSAADAARTKPNAATTPPFKSVLSGFVPTAYLENRDIQLKQAFADESKRCLYPARPSLMEWDKHASSRHLYVTPNKAQEATAAATPKSVDSC